MSAGWSTRALRLLILLGICLQMASAANIVNGATYYLKLVKSPYCKSSAQYVSYNNKKCGQNGPLLSKKDGSMSSKRWVVAVKRKESAKSWLVQLATTKTTCIGPLTVSKPSLCAKGTGAAEVKIVSTTAAQQWRLTEVATNTFTIAATNRATGCYRFLGASGNCSAPNLKLFKADDKKGAQRFVLEKQSTPKPSPSPGPRPSPSPSATTREAGQPTDVSGTLEGTTWAAKWTDGDAGNPVETYTVKCVAINSGCNSDAVGQPATDIARGVQQGAVGSLPNDGAYHCFVIAVNAASAVCSSPQTVAVGNVLVKPGKPTGVTSTRTPTSVTLKWTDSTVGVPQEAYAVECLPYPSACNKDNPLGTSAEAIPRGVQTGTASDLPTNTRMNCYVIAYNTKSLADDVCSDPVDIPAINSGDGRLERATMFDYNPALVTANQAFVTWALPAPTNPVETYVVKCWTSSSSSVAPIPNLDCNTVTPGPVFASDSITRSAYLDKGGYTINGLQPLTYYHCTVGSNNGASADDTCGTTDPNFSDFPNYITFQTL